MTRSDHSDMFIMHPEGSVADVLAAKIATEIEKEFGGDVWYGIETTDRQPILDFRREIENKPA